MALGDKLLEISEAILSSHSLLAVHLGDNNTTEKVFEEILIKFRIERTSLGRVPATGFGLVDSIEQMG